MYTIMNKILISLTVVGLVFSFASNADAYVSVKGYYRKDGTYVKPHVRSEPNGLKYDNYSYKPSQGLYNKSYGTKGSEWDTPTWTTDPDYYDGKAIYEGNATNNTSANNTVVNDSTPPDLTKASLTAYYNSDKKIASWNGSVYTSPSPFFEWSSATDDQGMHGYYISFDQDMYSDPEISGIYQVGNTYQSRKLDKSGTYYLHIKAVDKAGNRTPAYYWTYEYKANEGDYNDFVKDDGLAKRLAGKILIQTEKNGEAWYVNPKTYKRIYLKDGNAAFTIMRKYGLGITNEDFEKLHSGDKEMLERLKGKIVLRVQENGEAYYINPTDKKLYYLKDGFAAYGIMRNLGLGITNDNISRIATE
jgi:hypothetical protein